MNQVDQLLGPAAQHIAQFRIWSGCIVKPCFFQCEPVNIIGMKSRIPSGFLEGSKQIAVCSIPQVTQVVISSRDRNFPGKIVNTGIELVKFTGIEMTKSNGDGVLESGAV